jgi:trk system potassium uptake protein TrkA
VVERDEKRFEHVVNTLDVGALHANGASPHTLQGILRNHVDLFMAVTERDETNIFACMLAKKMRPDLITLARMRDLDYTEGDLVSSCLNVDQVISPEYLVARKMMQIAMLENVIDYNAIPSRGLEIARFRMGHNLQGIASIPLKHLQIPGDCKILFIQRNGRTFAPTDDDVLLTGDELVVIAKENGIAEFNSFLGTTKSSRDILIIGGGVVAQYLVSMLEELEHVSIRLIEEDEERCRELTQRFSRTIIINDDGADPLVLRSENVGMTDVMVCATGNEESDLLAGLVGKHLGVSKTITSFSNPDYKEIFQMVGIDSAISFYEVVANAIVKQTVLGHDVLIIMEGFQKELISVDVGRHSRVRDELIMDIDMPPKSVIAMVLTKEGAIIPEPNVRILEGDTVLLYADRSDSGVLERLFNTRIPLSP